jgi:hypothetical protein
MKLTYITIVYRISLILVLLVGAFFRFYGINWDQNQHLHPDERFLTMVQLELEIPDSIGNYLDSRISTLNPYNAGYDFFVYGTLPTTVNKILAVVLNNDDYNMTTLQGRALAGFTDLATLIMVMFFAQLLVQYLHYSRWLIPAAGFFYAIAVLPIQLAHFFTVDPWLTFFTFTSITVAVWQQFKPEWWKVGLSAVFFGAAMASKVSAVYAMPLILLLFLVDLKGLEKILRNKKFHIDIRKWGRTLVNVPIAIAFFGLLSFTSWRLLDPHAFAGLGLSRQFLDNLKSLDSFAGEDTWFPPAIQWINRTPILYALKNTALLGFGLPYFSILLCGFGLVFNLVSHKKHGWLFFLGLTAWILVYFCFQSVQFVKALRYFYGLYPFWAVYAGLGLLWMTEHFKRVSGKALFLIPIFVLLMIWPLMYLSIYVQPHSRIVASEWIYENVPDNTRVVNEHWDDGLPLALPGQQKRIIGEQLPVFGQDTPEKWVEIEQLMRPADYYFLTSNRAWGSMMRVPEKYPRQSQYYKDLFAGKTEWKKVAEFTSYPSLEYLGIPLTLPDDWADETFTVYDHPKVLLFQKR